MTDWVDLTAHCGLCGAIHAADDECQDTSDEARAARAAYLDELAEERAAERELVCH